MSEPFMTFDKPVPPRGWLDCSYVVRPSCFSPGRAVEAYTPDGCYLGEWCIDTDSCQAAIQSHADAAENYAPVIWFARDGSAVVIDSGIWQVFGKWPGEVAV